MPQANYISEDALDEFDEYKVGRREAPRARLLASLIVVLVVALGLIIVYTQMGGEEDGQALQEQQQTPTTTTSTPPTTTTPGQQTPTPPTTPPTTAQEPQSQTPTQTTTQRETETPETPQETEPATTPGEEQEETPPPTQSPPQTTQTTPTPQPLETQTTPPQTTVSPTQTVTPSETQTQTQTAEEKPLQEEPPSKPLTPLPEPQVIQLSPFEACENLERTQVNAEAIMCAVAQSFDLVSLARSLEGESPLETLVNIALWVRGNIEYSREEFGLEQYVLTPRELLTSGKGDSEDWSLLEFSLLTTLAQNAKPVFAEVRLEGEQAHYTAGLYLEGAVFLIEPEPEPYPRELLSDYYGMWTASGHQIKTVTLYMLGDTINQLLVYNVTQGWNATVPYNPTPEELAGAVDAALEVVIENGFYVDCPPYVKGVLNHMLETLPQSTPVVALPYSNVTLPLDWYVTHDYSWVKERVKAYLLSGAAGVLEWLGQNAPGHSKCVAVAGEIDSTRVERPVYVPNAMPETVEVVEEALIIYLAVADRLHVNVTHSLRPEGLSIVIQGDYKPGIIEVFLVRGAEEVAAITAPGWAYQGLVNLPAGSWEFNGTHTLITVPADALNTLGEDLQGIGVDVRLGGITVYLALLAPEP